MGSAAATAHARRLSGNRLACRGLDGVSDRAAVDGPRALSQDEVPAARDPPGRSFSVGRSDPVTMNDSCPGSADQPCAADRGSPVTKVNADSTLPRYEPGGRFRRR